MAKKTITLIFVLFLLVCLSSFVSAGIIDGFNRSNRNLGGDTADNGNTWVNVVGTCDIVSNEAHCGQNEEVYLQIADINITNDEYTNVTFEMQSDGVTNGWLRLNANTTTKIQIMFESTTYNIQALNNSAWVNCSTVYLNSTMYLLTVYNIDTTAGTYSLDINGTTCTNIEFDSGRTGNLNRTVLDTYTGAGNTYWDEIRTTDRLVIASENYESHVIEGYATDFSINLTWGTMITNITSVELIWNETSQYTLNTTQNDSGTNYSFNSYSNFVIPEIENLSLNIPFHWRVNVSLLNGSNATYDMANRTQVVYQVAITNCTAGNFTLNISIFDEEDTSTAVTSDLEATFTINYSGITNNHSFDLEGKSIYSFCINPNFANYTTNTSITYGATGYSTREHFLVEANLTNATQILNLYLINSSSTTDVYLYVRDTEYQEVEGVIIRILRYYIGTNEYLAVEETRTDVNGYAISRLVENDVNYRFILEYEGDVYLITNAMRIACVDTPCTKDFIINLESYENYFTLYDGIDGVTYSTAWNNATKLFSFTFTDTTGLTPTMRFYVIRDSITGNTTVCNSTLTATAGTINCNLSAYNDGTFFWRAGRRINPETIFAWGSLEIDEIWRTFGTEGVFWSWILTLTMFAIGVVTNAGVGIGLVILSAIGLSYLQWVNFTYMIMVVIVISALVILAFMRKREVS